MFKPFSAFVNCHTNGFRIVCFQCLEQRKNFTETLLSINKMFNEKIGRIRDKLFSSLNTFESEISSSTQTFEHWVQRGAWKLRESRKFKNGRFPELDACEVQQCLFLVEPKRDQCAIQFL